MVSVVRITALSWADMLAGFVMYVMMNYLTDVWNLSTIHAAGILNIWNGITQVLPIVFTFFVDAFMGDYYMLVVSSISYTIGLGFLFMSTPPIFGPCSKYKEECIGHTQKVLFFTALAFIAVGVAGLGVSLEPFTELQKKRAAEKEKEKDANEGAAEEEKEKDANEGATEEEKEKDKNMPLCQKLGLLTVAIVGAAGVIGLPYIKPWSIRFSIASICTLVTTVLFLSGCRGYECSKPEGSPFTAILRVFIASVRNKSQPLTGRTQLYNDDLSGYTSSLRCLDKAAIKLHGEQQEVKSWKLCSVGEVEETKIHIRIIPMWLTFIVIGTILSVGNTYFLEQANKMDRKLGKIKIPTEFFLVPFSLASLTSKLAFRIMRGCLPTKRALPIGMALTMVYSVISCIIAAKVETRRLHVIRDHGLLEKPDEGIPMSIFWLVPQFIVLGWVQGTASVSFTCFFKQKAPESMLKYLGHIIMGVQGLGTMAGVLMVHIVGKVSQRNQKRNWFQSTLNESHLDRYYWTLAAVSAANLLLHIIISLFYKYKNDPLPVRKVKQVRGDKSDPRQIVNRVVLESIKSNGG